MTAIVGPVEVMVGSRPRYNPRHPSCRRMSRRIDHAEGRWVDLVVAVHAGVVVVVAVVVGIEVG